MEERIYFKLDNGKGLRLGISGYELLDTPVPLKGKLENIPLLGEYLNIGADSFRVIRKEHTISGSRSGFHKIYITLQFEKDVE